MNIDSIGLRAVSRLVMPVCIGLATWPGASHAQPVRDVFQKVSPSVVVVHTVRRVGDASARSGSALSPDGVGSGVLVDRKGLVLTAAHVIAQADGVEVEFSGGERIPARVVASAPFADVALLQIDRVPAAAVVAALGDSQRAQVGEQVLVIGTPYGIGHTLAVGWLSGRRLVDDVIENLTALEVLQLDAAVYEGNSGGPVFNLAGEVIGLVSHAVARGAGLTGPSFAVASNVARELMLESRRPWLGFETHFVYGELALALNVPQPAGLLVQSVADGSLGDRLGLREGTLPVSVGEQTMLLGGDIILAMLGMPITADERQFAQLQDRLGRVQPGDTLEVEVWRAGRTATLRTVVGER